MKTNLPALLLLVGTTWSGLAADLTWSANTGIWSRYMWRGLRFSNGPVWQSSITATYGGFSASLWDNFDIDTVKVNEIDPTLTYTWSWKPITLSVGWNHFGVIDGADSDELFTTATWDGLWVTPSLSLYTDVNYGKGAYLQAGLSKSFTLSERVSLNLAANAGTVFNNRYMGVNSRGDEFVDLFNGEVTMSLPVKITSWVSFEPKAGLAFPLSQNAREAMRGYGFGPRATTFFGGFQFNFTF